MAKTITSDVVEAYSFCPRKAFLLVAGTTPDPGQHEHELFIQEQADANRQAHQLRLANTHQVVLFTGSADLALGRDVLSNVELASGVLQARFDFLAKVDVPSQLGRYSYKPVKVIGTCKASKSDALVLTYQSLVLSELQGRQPTLGTLTRQSRNQKG
jgi:hypothetical protein